MEFAQAAAALGLRAIHGAEVDGARRARRRRSTMPATSRCSSATRAAGEPLPAAHARAGRTRARRDARRSLGAPSVTLADVEDHAEGLVCLSGCARQGVHDEPTLRRLLRRLRPRRLPRRAAAPVPPPRPRAATAASPRSPQRLGVPLRGDRQRPRAHARARARCRTRFVAVREHTTLDASEPLRRGNHSHVLATPEAMAARFADHPEAVAETARLAETLRFDLTQRPRLPLPRRRGRRAPIASSPRSAARSFEARYPPGSPLRDEARRAPGGGAARDRQARPVRLLPAAPRHARARARGRGRGARARHRARAAAARPRARLVGLLDRLLPHRPLARRPGREQALPRALPQRGDHRAARHRPRLPARRARAC